MQTMRRLIDKVAPCDARVLITGENGTGKELVARWLHAKSNRAGAPFVEVNCAAIPSGTDGAELFGHERRFHLGHQTAQVRQIRTGERAERSSWTRSATCRWRRRQSAAGPAKSARSAAGQRQRRRCRCAGIIAATNKNLREETKGGISAKTFSIVSALSDQSTAPARTLGGYSPAGRSLHRYEVCEEYDMPRKPMDKKVSKCSGQMPWTGKHPRTSNVTGEPWSWSGTSKNRHRTRRTLPLNISEATRESHRGGHHVVCPVFINSARSGGLGHTDRPDTGCPGRIHIDARIPGVQHRSGFRIRIGENLPHHLRIGLEQDSGGADRKPHRNGST